MASRQARQQHTHHIRCNEGERITYQFSFCVSGAILISFPSFSSSAMLYTSAAMDEALRWPFLTSSAVAGLRSSVSESTLDKSDVSAAMIADMGELDKEVGKASYKQAVEL
jgi:hypothetical protein